MKIMAVDSNRLTLQELGENLRKVFEGDEIILCSGPLEALSYSNSNKVDILFTDVRLKPIDGYELMSTIRRKQHCLAYIVSGSRDKPDDFSWMGGNGCFTKPISREELMVIAKDRRNQSE